MPNVSKTNVMHQQMYESDVHFHKLTG